MRVTVREERGVNFEDRDSNRVSKKETDRDRASQRDSVKVLERVGGRFGMWPLGYQSLGAISREACAAISRATYSSREAISPARPAVGYQEPSP
jgi:hypothetical protein